MREPIQAASLSKTEIDRMAGRAAGLPGKPTVSAPMTEEEKRRKAEAFQKMYFGELPKPGQGTVQSAAEGVRAGAEAPASGVQNREKSAAARNPEKRGPGGRESNAGSTGSRAAQTRGTAPDGREIPEHLRTKPNKRENEFMMNLMILRNTLKRNGPAIRERARLAGKWVWRDIRLATVLICRIQDALLRTMPRSREDYYMAYAQHGHYELHIDGPIRMPRQVVISDKHLAAICDAAMENECIMCMREGKEIDRCGLREALLAAAAPTEIREGDDLYRRCEYREAAGNLIQGKDVTI